MIAPPPWLARLHEVLRRVRLPVGDVVLSERRLEIDLLLLDAPRLRVHVTPHAVGRRGFGRTSRYVIGFDGAGDLDPAGQQALARLIEVLRRVEAALPANLEGVGGVFVTGASAEERFARLFPFCTVERSRAGDREITELLVRMTRLCNQHCPFCSAPDHATPPPSTLAAMIREAPQVFPALMLSLTGGEPTLRPSFASELRLALELDGIARVQVQTNAVTFARKLDPATFPPSPRLAFFVSLHALDPDVYDRCTGTTGQLQLALEGVGNLLRAKHDVTINCVISSANVDHLDDYVRELARHWIGSPLKLHFSTIICPETRPEAASFLVPYPLVAARLRTIVPLATERGIVVESLRSSTHASMPPCMLAPEERERDPHRPRILPHETGFEDFSRAWVKSSRCRECVESEFCLGVPRAYAQRFGLADLSPLRPDAVT
jgi:pyruvate-formate lyase-activating enzyme